MSNVDVLEFFVPFLAMGCLLGLILAGSISQVIVFYCDWLLDSKKE